MTWDQVTFLVSSSTIFYGDIYIPYYLTFHNLCLLTQTPLHISTYCFFLLNSQFIHWNLPTFLGLVQVPFFYEDFFFSSSPENSLSPSRFTLLSARILCSCLPFPMLALFRQRPYLDNVWIPQCPVHRCSVSISWIMNAVQLDVRGRQELVRHFSGIYHIRWGKNDMF